MAKEDPLKGKDNAASPASGDEVKTLKTEVEQLKATNQQLQTQQSEIQSVLVSPQFQEFMKSKNQPGELDRSSFAAGRQEIDLETMDRAQFAQYLLDQITGQVTKQVNPQITRLSDDMQREQLARGIKDARGKFGDFDNFAAKMGQVSARIERSGLTAEDIYKISTHTPKKVDDKDGDDEGKPGTQTTEKPGGAGGELKAGADKETPKETAARIFDELKIGDKKE